LLWCVWRLIRQPRAEWPGLVLLAAVAAAYTALSGPLFYGGAHLKLLLMQPTYEAVLAEADRTQPQHPMIRGRSRGAAYFFNFDSASPSAIVFPWVETPNGGFTGIVYDPSDCPPKPEPPLPPPPPVSDSHLPPVMRAGRMGDRHWLAGHYCTISFVGM
jgi:hypothetical protein